MHFTYAEKPDLTKLKQGDILKRTPELLSLISEVHPHYKEDKYLYFQVVTQTCDLVVRGSSTKSRYITIAAVRNIDSVIQRAVEGFSNKTTFNEDIFCSKSHKKSLVDLFTKLFNNNDSNHFFLKAVPEFGLNEDCCTLLHLSISIRASEHYQKCLDAKILELNENFRAKLGWMVGNLYSRVGTEDYVPTVISDQKQFDEFIESQMSKYVAWIDESDFSSFVKKIKSAETLEEAMIGIEEDRERKRDTQLSQIVGSISSAVSLSDEQCGAIKNALSQDPIIQKALNKK